MGVMSISGHKRVRFHSAVGSSVHDRVVASQGCRHTFLCFWDLDAREAVSSSCPGLLRGDPWWVQPRSWWRREGWQNPASPPFPPPPPRGVRVGLFQGRFIDLAGLQSFICHLVRESQPSLSRQRRAPFGDPFPDAEGPWPVKFRSYQKEEVSDF